MSQKAYVPKNAYFGAKMAVFQPIIPNILGWSKSFGAHLSKNHLGKFYPLQAKKTLSSTLRAPLFFCKTQLFYFVHDALCGEHGVPQNVFVLCTQNRA